MFKKTMVVLLSAVSVSALAAEYSWIGGDAANPTVWDLTSLNWTQDGATPCAFASGGDAVIGKPVELTFGATMNPKTVTVDIDSGTVKFDTSSGTFTPFKQTESLVKTGAGTLYLYQVENSVSGGTGFGKDAVVDIQEGEVDATAVNRANLLPCRVVVRSGATLKSIDRNAFGVPGTAPSCETDLSLAGSLILSCTKWTWTQDLVKTLALDGGRVYAMANNSGYPGMLQISDSIVVTGSVARTMQLELVPGYTGGGKNKFMFNPVKNVVFKVDDVTGGKETDLLFKGPYAAVSDSAVEGYDKTGAGTLEWDCSSDWPAGDVNILEGEWRLAEYQGIWKSYDQTFTVSTNASLVIPLRCAFSRTTEDLKTCFHIDHGSYIIGDSKTSNQAYNFVGRKVVLDNATFKCNMLGNGNKPFTDYGALLMGELFSMKGEKPYLFESPKDRESYAAWNLFKAPYTEFHVEKTDDSGIDATFKVAFRDWMPEKLPGGFVKTGDGTMKLWSALSAFSGDVTVREGTLLLEKDFDAYSPEYAQDGCSYLGCMQSNRTIAVESGAKLKISDRYMLAQPSSVPVTDYRAKFVFNGGSLEIADNALPVFGDMEFNGATVSYGAGSGWGVVYLAGNVKVGGTAMTEFPNTGADNQWLTFGGTNQVFDVADAAVGDDFKISIPLQTWLTADYPCGFTKKGVGCLHLASTGTKNPYSGVKYLDGDINVDGGTLLVDGNYDLSAAAAVKVADGAAIGGSGSVRNLQLSSSSGFAVSAGQTEPLKVTGDLTLPAESFVDVIAPDPENVGFGRMQVVRATGTLSGDISGWKVRVNGVQNDLYRLRKDANGISVRQSTGLGLMLILR